MDENKIASELVRIARDLVSRDSTQLLRKPGRRTKNRSNSLPRKGWYVESPDGEYGEIVALKGDDGKGYMVKVKWETKSGWSWAYWENLTYPVKRKVDPEADSIYDFGGNYGSRYSTDLGGRNARVASGEKVVLPGNIVFVNGLKTGYFDMDGKPLRLGQTVRVLYHRGRGNYSSAKGILLEVHPRRILLDGNTGSYIKWIRGKMPGEDWRPKWEIVSNFPWGRGNRGVGETRYSLDGYPVKDRDQVVKILSEHMKEDQSRWRG